MPIIFQAMYHRNAPLVPHELSIFGQVSESTKFKAQFSEMTNAIALSRMYNA
jgi:hypothetical protein